MHIAIDDTYGAAGSGDSQYVTDDRRTHLAVVFPDDEVKNIRRQMNECLKEVLSLTGIAAPEFHFVDLYNRTGPWESLKTQGSDSNLRIFQAFATIYSTYKWPVHIQTVDDRTLKDHGIAEIEASFDGLNLTKRSDLSLFFLLVKIKKEYKNSNEPLTLYLDEGRKKPGNPFGRQIFWDWPCEYTGYYQSSAAEPLLQVADFIAFCINRVTHITLKSVRTNLDNDFIGLVTSMGIISPDFKYVTLPRNFLPSDIDKVHKIDRIEKGLEKDNL